MDIRDLCDGIVLNTAYSISVNPTIDFEELNQIIEYCNTYSKLCIIDISSIMDNKEIDDVKSFILE